MTKEFIITVQDIYAVRDVQGGLVYCGSGARRWFAQYGFNWGAFIQHGLPASVLAATGDALILRVIAHAEQLRDGVSEAVSNLTDEADEADYV